MSWPLILSCLGVGRWSLIPWGQLAGRASKIASFWKPDEGVLSAFKPVTSFSLLMPGFWLSTHRFGAGS